MNFEQILATLTPREEKVIKMILERQSLSDISKHFEVSTDRLSQIISKGLRKIKHLINTQHAIFSKFCDKCGCHVADDGIALLGTIPQTICTNCFERTKT